jgi:hypothetical protein
MTKALGPIGRRERIGKFLLGEAAPRANRRLTLLPGPAYIQGLDPFQRSNAAQAAKGNGGAGRERQLER